MPYPVNSPTQSYIDSNLYIQNQLASIGASPGQMVRGSLKKDVVCGPNMNGDWIAIYGWFYPNGDRIQGYDATKHAWYFVDYSHGAGFVDYNCILDDKPYDIRNVFRDPDLSQLVSNQGPFEPYWPNIGSKKPSNLPIVDNNPPKPSAVANLIPPNAKPPDYTQGYGTANPGASALILGLGLVGSVLLWSRK